jgi:hypothetical protein
MNLAILEIDTTDPTSIPNLWTSARKSSGPFKLLFPFGHALVCSLTTQLLKFAQGIHHCSSGYEFIYEDPQSLSVRKNGDYMGRIRVGLPSVGNPQSVFIVQSRNITKARARGFLSINESYAEDVDKAVSLASKSFLRPSPVQIYQEIRRFVNSITLDGIIRNARTSATFLNDQAERFAVSIKQHVMRNDSESLYIALQGKTMLLRKAAVIVQAYKQQQGEEVSWDTHDPSLNLDSLLQDLHDDLTNVQEFNLDTFLNGLAQYRDGIEMTRLFDSSGCYVVMNSVKDIHVFNNEAMRTVVRCTTSKPIIPPDAYMFYRKGLDNSCFPTNIRDAVHGLHTTGILSYSKGLGIMLAQPDSPVTAEYKNGTLFYLAPEVC